MKKNLNRKMILILHEYAGFFSFRDNLAFSVQILNFECELQENLLSIRLVWAPPFSIHICLLQGRRKVRILFFFFNLSLFLPLNLMKAEEMVTLVAFFLCSSELLISNSFCANMDASATAVLF